MRPLRDSRLMRGFCHLLLAASLSLCAAAAPAQPAAEASPAFESQRRARAAVDAAVAAMGGEDKLRGLATVRREMIWTYLDAGQQRRPWTGPPDPRRPGDYSPALVSSFVDYRGTRFALTERFEDGPGDVFVHRDAGDAGGGFETGRFREEMPFFGTHSPEDFAALRARNLRHYPEALLRAALERPEALLWVGRRIRDGRAYDVVSFSDGQGPLLLYFDAASRLLARTESLRDHAVLGDTSAETIFEDYRSAGALLLPFAYHTRIGGYPSRVFRLTAIELDGAADEALFRPPEARVAIQRPPAAPTLRDAGKGVYEILGPYNLMFAVFGDYVLLVEAPLDEAYAETAFRLIRSVAADKPVRLVATHFHYDHIGGIRFAVAQGAEIWTTAHGRETILRALASRRTFRPDRLSRSPREPVIHVVGDQAIFDDGMQRVEVRNFGPTMHADHILAAWFPRVRTLHVADLWDILTPELALGGTDAEIVLHRAREMGFGFERFVPVHGVPAARPDLERAMAIRARYVPPVDIKRWTRN